MILFRKILAILFSLWFEVYVWLRSLNLTNFRMKTSKFGFDLVIFMSFVKKLGFLKFFNREQALNTTLQVPQRLAMENGLFRAIRTQAQAPQRGLPSVLATPHQDKKIKIKIKKREMYCQSNIYCVNLFSINYSKLRLNFNTRIS